MSFARDGVHRAALPNNTDAAWEGRARRRVFLRTVLVVLAAGALYTLLQPAHYESTATVLMSAPAAIDQQALEADVQGVAIQRRTLLGSEITRQLINTLDTEYGMSLTPLDLRGMLEVRPVPETNLLELAASGARAGQLPLLVESWIEVYTRVRAREIEVRKAQTLTEVAGELTGLSGRIEAARDALERYREENDIISMERQENAVMSQLDGLNSALNRAVEEEIRAESYLNSLRSSIEAGERIVPDSERSEVAATAQLLADLRARLDELRARYTDDYIRKAPQLREIPEQITQLESELERAYTQGAREELANAERAHRAARESVANLERRLQEHKASVARFNTIYARHQALVEDLTRLEELNRDTQARQVQIEVSPVEKYPQVSVIDWPAAEADRLGPPYALLLGGSTLAAVIAGIFAVWLYAYLNPRPAASPIINLSGVRLSAGDSTLTLEQDSREAERRLNAPDDTNKP